MARSISASAKKRGRPKTTGTGQTIGVRMQPSLLAALDGMIAEAPSPITRPEAIRVLVEDGLKAQGRLPHREDPEMAN